MSLFLETTIFLVVSKIRFSYTCLWWLLITFSFCLDTFVMTNWKNKKNINLNVRILYTLHMISYNFFARPRRRRSHTQACDAHIHKHTLTPINARTHTLPLRAPLKNRVGPTNLEIDEVTTGTSMSWNQKKACNRNGGNFSCEILDGGRQHYCRLNFKAMYGLHVKQWIR
jgi:hypothetical protein